ncbi:hypothetical protein [Tenacibaculum sp.]|uniref:hypothetical protein n=1 Tax=Tenacibaculum sp. TaxID=1906242 RepID=UPI003D0A6EA6
MDKYQGFPIPEHIIDYIYVLGYITDEDYKKYYMDSTRTYRPKLDLNNLEFLEDFHKQCDREEVVENKNVMLYEAEVLKDLLL